MLSLKEEKDLIRIEPIDCQGFTKQKRPFAFLVVKKMSDDSKCLLVVEVKGKCASNKNNEI